MAQRHMDRLTSFDTSFLANEKANAHMAIGAVLMFDGRRRRARRTSSPRSAAASHQLPRLRQRLLYPPLGLGTPFWVDYRDVRHPPRTCAALTLPAPGTEDQFRALVGELLAPPLDRAQAALGADPGRGLRRTSASRSSTRPTTRWPTASPRSTSGCCSSTSSRKREPAREEAPWTPAPHALAAPASPARAGAGIVATLRRLGRWLRRALRDPAGAAPARRRRPRRPLGGDLEPGPPGAEGAASTPRSAPVASFCWATFDLAEFKRIKNALGGTVNDVSLAVAAGALRALAARARRRPSTGSS